MKSILTLAAACVFLVSCGSSGSLPSKPNYRQPTTANKKKVYKPQGEWEIRSANDLTPLVKLGASVSEKSGVLIVDLKGITIDGSKQKGDGGQNERQTPLFRARTPLVMKNGFITNNKNAATYYAPNSGVDRITWTNIGEDAVATADGAKNFSVTNCEFLNDKDGDKSIQLNEADGAVVRNNMVYGGITGARIGKYDYSSKNDSASAGGNKFIGMDTAWNVGEVELVITGKNEYTNVNKPFVATKGAKIKNADGKVYN